MIDQCPLPSNMEVFKHNSSNIKCSSVNYGKDLTFWSFKANRRIQGLEILFPYQKLENEITCDIYRWPTASKRIYIQDIIRFTSKFQI